jgi:hypothetical protein
MATLDVRSSSNDRRLVSSSTSHTTAVNSSTANEGVEQNTSKTVAFVTDELFSPTYYIRRPCFEFDTSSLGASANISSGQITVTITSTDQDADNTSFNLFYFTRGSTPGTAFVANDYDEAQGTAGSTAKDISGLSTPQTFTLNASALAAINKTGYTQFCLRLSSDYSDSAPSGRNALFGGDGNAVSEADRPRLELTYTTGSPSVGGFITTNSRFMS